MENKFISALQLGEGYSYLLLRGIIDEDNGLAALASQVQGRLLLIDMAEVDRINSCGVRDWVNWLNQIQVLGVQVILLRCSPAVVAQANMVTNFLGDAFIHSFYAPYVHPESGEEQSVLLFSEELRQQRPIVAPKIYSEGGEELEFDEFEESYFAFVQDPRILNYHIANDIQAVICYFLPEANARRPVVSSKVGGQMLSLLASQVSSAVPAHLYASQSQVQAVQRSHADAQRLPGQGVVNPYASANPYASSLSQSPVANAQMGGMASQQGAALSGMMPKPVPQPARHSQPPLPSGQLFQALPLQQASSQAAYAQAPSSAYAPVSQAPQAVVAQPSSNAWPKASSGSNSLSAPISEKQEGSWPSHPAQPSTFAGMPSASPSALPPQGYAEPASESLSALASAPSNEAQARVQQPFSQAAQALPPQGYAEPAPPRPFPTQNLPYNRKAGGLSHKAIWIGIIGLSCTILLILIILLVKILS